MWRREEIAMVIVSVSLILCQVTGQNGATTPQTVSTPTDGTSTPQNGSTPPPSSPTQGTSPNKTCEESDLEFSPPGTCGQVDPSHSQHSCKPCKNKYWFELVLRQREDELDKRAPTNCYNEFPLGILSPPIKPVFLTKGIHEHRLSYLVRPAPVGFITPRLAFYEDYRKKTMTTPAQAPAGPAGAPQNQEVDVQLLEWPGRTHEHQRKHLESRERKFCRHTRPVSLKGEKVDRVDNEEACNFKMLKFERDSSKILEYPCNREEGTDIIAFGLMTVAGEVPASDQIPPSKLYLSFTRSNIFRRSTQPLYLHEKVLNQMAKSADEQTNPDGICLKEEEEPLDCDFSVEGGGGDSRDDTLCERRQKFFQDREYIFFTPDNCEGEAGPGATTPSGPSAQTPGTSPAPSQLPDTPQPEKGNEKAKRVSSITGDLITALDFTFVQNRLIIGMRCGIIVVENLLRRHLTTRPATLLGKTGRHKNTFNSVSKISSSICCSSQALCQRTLIAGYPSPPTKLFDHPKEIYISFDLGDTFTSKLIAEEHSALNLMWGMYKMYGKWLLYHQLLEAPDPEDIRNEHGEEIYPGYAEHRQAEDWASLPLDRKERRFLYGADDTSLPPDLESRKRAMRSYIKIRTKGALARFVRHRRRGREIKLDLAPGWLRQEIDHVKESSAQPWKRGWTDTNCDSIPQCRVHFKNDPAVDFFLDDAGIIVKTPRRSIDDAFCDQLVSLSVSLEKDTLYALCVVGFGDFQDSYDASKTLKKPNPAGNYSCNSRVTEEIHKDQPNCYYDPTSGQETQSYKYNKCTYPVKYYAIFTLVVKEKLPIVLVQKRKTEQVFTCQSLIRKMDKEGCMNTHILPEIVRVPNSISLFVKNCKEVLYYSPNGGRTVFNTVFYAKSDEHTVDASECNSKPLTGAPSPPTSRCHSGPTTTGPSTTTPDPGPTNTTEPSARVATTAPPAMQPGTAKRRKRDTKGKLSKFEEMYHLKALNVPPLIAVASTQDYVFMTMGNTYAFGLIGVNREFQMIVGHIFPPHVATILDRLEVINATDYVVPIFSNSGEPFFGVAVRFIYGHHPGVNKELVKDRNGIRLVNMDFLFHKEVANFYEENEDLTEEARLRNVAIGPCTTFSLKVKPRYLMLDVDDKGVVHVTSHDAKPNIPLGLLSSEEKSILVDVELVDRKTAENQHLVHAWDIQFTALKSYKSRVEALVDSFFGVENNIMNGFNTEVSLANHLNFRCHVQPASSVSVKIDCFDRKLVAHEDEYRPQCTSGMFSKTIFRYRLRKGQFNPQLASYWIQEEGKEGNENNAFTIDKETGDLVVLYDYLKFGCPLEPYKDDPFIPNLRVVTAQNRFNTSLGLPYNGSFLLIELFGAKGFYFSQKFSDAGCKYVPVNVTDKLLEWIHRQRMFRIAAHKQRTPVDEKTLDEIRTVEELTWLEHGNQRFFPEAVDNPINIINRVTYMDCQNRQNFPLESEKINMELTRLDQVTRKRMLAQQLPILKRGGKNVLHWAKNSQRMYIFLAVALDPKESLCEYSTMFAVSLPDEAETNTLITFSIFLLLLILWILLFFCGYWYRKSRIRSLCIYQEEIRRLEEAAWKVVYEYERTLLENDNHRLELEIREMSDKKSKQGTEDGKHGKGRESQISTSSSAFLLLNDQKSGAPKERRSARFSDSQRSSISSTSIKARKSTSSTSLKVEVPGAPQTEGEPDKQETQVHPDKTQTPRPSIESASTDTSSQSGSSLPVPPPPEIKRPSPPPLLQPPAAPLPPKLPKPQSTHPPTLPPPPAPPTSLELPPPETESPRGSIRYSEK